MKFLGFSLSAAVALVLAGGSAFAGDTNEISAMKATMDSMKQEMEAMRATMASERESIRASAGGAPEALKSANGKATVKIGGELRVRYAMGWESGYNTSDYNDVTRYADGDWALRQAKLKFQIDMTPDTKGYFSLRLDRTSAGPGGLLDESWYKWSNIGGTGFAAQVGLLYMDAGMYNGDSNPWGRVMVWDPFVKDAGQTGSFDRATKNGPKASTYYQEHNVIDSSHLGINVEYKWDQFKVSAGIFDGANGVTGDGEVRNFGLSNHYLTAYYDPCWLEGLHLQASYVGLFDADQGATETDWRHNSIPNNGRRGGSYVPSFDFGVYYKASNWAVYGEAVVTAGQNYYEDSSSIVFSVGADYSLTEKLRIGGEFDYKSAYMNNESRMFTAGMNQTGMRASLGANYDFGNGLYIRAQYSHYWLETYGISNSGNDCRDNDQIAFQTGFKF